MITSTGHLNLSVALLWLQGLRLNAIHERGTEPGQLLRPYGSVVRVHLPARVKTSLVLGLRRRFRRMVTADPWLVSAWRGIFQGCVAGAFGFPARGQI